MIRSYLIINFPLISKLPSFEKKTKMSVDYGFREKITFVDPYCILVIIKQIKGSNSIIKY